ncbi:uracil-xanthine permease family protein [Azospirillum thermophilum]|uniref:Xanthine/uracil permease n=1 Tax=Azospirillum thermophilum TaxID=2202148 RepID=A0A2S2D0G7_9PROT|nr:solute carrier family 23 protein [Azospirillum thermophilum]AWK89957.1 hypothetical protein DEW08_28515 [Azospirillum thermophilum]
MNDRPQNLLYAVDERPPPRVLGVMAMQHMVLGLMFMMYPVIAAGEIGLDAAARQALVTTATLAVGFATILQASPIGSGFLAVALPNPLVLPVFVGAARAGGLGAACGTLAVCGLMQMGLARMLPRLRVLFPPEVCGVAVTMLGVSMIGGGVRRFSGFDPQTMTVSGGSLAVGFATFGTIAALSVWSKGQLRLYAMLAGCVLGYGAAAALGKLGPEAWTAVADAPLLGLPVPHIPALSFSFDLLTPLFIAILLTVTDSVGCFITMDKMNKAHWARTDMKVLSRGVFAEGLANTLAGAAGTFGVGLSSANIGLSFASGVTARVVGMAAGILLIAAAFVPKLTTLLIHMPEPVIGAVLVFTAACLITAGMELIMSRMLNDRRMLVIGLSMILGLSVQSVPGLYKSLPAWFEPLVHSELTVGAVVALVLNLLFRIGIARRATLEFQPGTTPLGAVYDFMERQGSLWGARRDVVQRATQGLVEALETLQQSNPRGARVTVEATFDELALDLRLRYPGAAMVLEPAALDMEALLDSDDHGALDTALRQVSATLLTRIADRVSASNRNGEAMLYLHFAH